MTKKPEKSESEIQEIAFEVEKSEIFFLVDGSRRFKMPAEVFLKMLNPGYLEELAKKVEHPNENFEGLGLQHYVCVSRLLKKGLALDKIAKVMSIPEPRLRAFYGSAQQRFKINDPATRMERERQEKESHDFCLCLQPRSDLVAPAFMLPVDDYRFIELNEVKQMQAKQMSPGEIAWKLKIDKNSFETWLLANQAYLDLL